MGDNMKRLGLIPKLIISIIVGILVGLYAPDSVFRFTETGRMFLGNLVSFFIPLIMVFFITASISEFGEDAGRILGYTVGISYVSTLIACIIAAVAAYTLVPVFALTGGELVEAVEIGEPFLELDMPPVMDIMSALILSFILGIGIAQTRSSGLSKAFSEGKNIMLMMVEKVVIPLIPIYIAFIFVELAASGQVFGTMVVFAKMLVLIIILQFVWLAMQYAFAGTYSRQNPIKSLKTMIPAYLTALGTMSSAATMPVSLEQGKKLPNMESEIAEFVMPLCSNVHMSGTAMTITISAITVNYLTKGVLPSVGNIIGFIILLAVVEVGAVGVPGGSIMAALGILSTSLAFGDTELGLMMAIFTIQDSFGTATNITGDGAIALIINRIFGKENKKEMT